MESNVKGPGTEADDTDKESSKLPSVKTDGPSYRIKVNLSVEEDPYPQNRSIYYNSIVIAGGSVKGFAFLGVLQYLQDKYMLRKVTRYYGTSIGSSIAYLLSIGYTPTEIMILLITERVLEKIHDISPLNCVNGKGAVSMQPLLNFLEKITIKKIGYCPTFEHIYRRYSKFLTIVTHNLTTGDTEYMNPETHPDMSCITAIRMSCSIPLVFETYKYKDAFYTDGCITDPFPIERAITEDSGKIFGVTFDYNKTIPSGPEPDSLSILELFQRILPDILNSRGRKFENLPRRCAVINLKFDNHQDNMIKFDMTIANQLGMFSEGYQKAREFYEKD